MNSIKKDFFRINVNNKKISLKYNLIGFQRLPSLNILHVYLYWITSWFVRNDYILPLIMIHFWIETTHSVEMNLLFYKVEIHASYPPSTKFMIRLFLIGKHSADFPNYSVQYSPKRYFQHVKSILILLYLRPNRQLT